MGDHLPGVYSVYTILSERCEVDLDVELESEVIFTGQEINIGGLEPDCNGGDMDAQVFLAHPYASWE